MYVCVCVRACIGLLFHTLLFGLDMAVAAILISAYSAVLLAIAAKTWSIACPLS